MQRGRRYDELRVAAAKIDGVGHRLMILAAQRGLSGELDDVRQELDRAQARRWALIAIQLANGATPARIAMRAGVDQTQVEELAEALHRAHLGFGS